MLNVVVLSMGGRESEFDKCMVGEMKNASLSLTLVRNARFGQLKACI